jgi:hypothetical protein
MWYFFVIESKNESRILLQDNTLQISPIPGTFQKIVTLIVSDDYAFDWYF